MKKYVLQWLLLISLAFNLAFIGLFAYHQFTLKKSSPHHPPIKHFIHKHPFFERKNDAIRELRHDFIQQKREFMNHVRENEMSVQELEQELDFLLEKQMAMEQHIGNFLIEMRQKLTDEQVERFFRNREHLREEHWKRERYKEQKNRRKQ